MAENRRILVIDDEEMIIDLLKRRFTRLGWNVKVASDGEQALNIIEKEKFDLVVCDVKMPHRVSGLDVLNATKKCYPDIPFVAISGYLMTDDSIQNIMDNGAAMFIKKPFPSLAETTKKIVNLVN